MKNTLKFLLIASLCAIFFTTCRKDEPLESTSGNQINIPQKNVTASINGLIIDESGAAIEEVSVTLNNETVSTDRNGVFSFRNKTLNSLGAVLQIEKAGFFTVQKLLVTNADQKAYLKVMLMKRSLTTSFSATQGADITTTDGAKVNIPANAIQTDDGATYTGTVKAYVKWLDPSDRSVTLQMPGDLRAINEQDEFVQLATYGMIGVELVGASGEPLQLNGTQKATIELPIPSDLLGSAPTTIPLWHMDDKTGYWVEEGSASIQGNAYVGEVGHFSFWNCDAPFELVNIEGKVVSEGSGLGMPNQLVVIKVVSSGITRGGYTDAEGNFSGAVPKNELLEFSVGSYVCGFINTYNITVGPFDADPNVTILLSLAEEEINNIHFEGTLVKCDGTPLVYGYVKVQHSSNWGQTIEVDENGAFSGDLVFCSNSGTTGDLTIQGIDFDTYYESEIMEFPITAGNNEIDAGAIEVCVEPIDEDFYYQIDGGNVITPFFPYAILLPITNPNTLTLAIYGSLGVAIGTSTIFIDNPVLGENNPSSINLIISNPLTGTTCGPCNNLVVNLTEIGEVGELVKGTFSGTVDDDGVDVTVTGGFEVMRDN